MKAVKIQAIISQIETILQKVHADQKQKADVISGVNENYTKSATNLINYLSLRSFDLRELQHKLGYLGMSRLARAEAHTEASLKTTLFFLRQYLGIGSLHPRKYTISIKKSEKLRQKNTNKLLGKATNERRLRIMVTLPATAAEDPKMVEEMISKGMDIARINCAHDTPDVWLQMIHHVKDADLKLGRHTMIAMDIGGPKIRTGQLLKGAITLKIGDQIILDRRPVAGTKSSRKKSEKQEPARISCTLPEVFEFIKAGDPVYFDDGAIKGIIKQIHEEEATIEIVHTKDEISKLKADKGINFPSSNLKIKGLTQTDREDLTFISQHADIVNFSFVNTAQDVREMHEYLRSLNALDHLGIIYKIETQEAYNNLIPILLEAMKGPKVGVMIARGDLAIEAGWNQMGMIQKEMLAICNACHIPIVWATQVLENLAKKGLPSRSEITDAVNSTKAECVMLNKGPHITRAIELLDQIIKNAEPYQDKNAPLLPRLEKIKVTESTPVLS